MAVGHYNIMSCRFPQNCSLYIRDMVNCMMMMEQHIHKRLLEEGLVLETIQDSEAEKKRRLSVMTAVSTCSSDKDGEVQQKKGLWHNFSRLIWGAYTCRPIVVHPEIEPE